MTDRTVFSIGQWPGARNPDAAEVEVLARDGQGYSWMCDCGHAAQRFSKTLGDVFAAVGTHLAAHVADPPVVPDSYTCPLCGRTTHGVKDIEYGYCPGCHAFTRECALRSMAHCQTVPAAVFGNIALCSVHAGEVGKLDG